MQIRPLEVGESCRGRKTKKNGERMRENGVEIREL